MWLLKHTKTIYPSQPANTLNVSKLIHAIIGWEASRCSSSWLEDEDISSFTTIHQAIALAHITQPMKTEKKAKIR